MKEITCYYDEESKNYKVISIEDDNKPKELSSSDQLFYSLQKCLCQYADNAMFRGQSEDWNPIASIFRDDYKHILENEEEYYKSVKRDHDIELEDTQNEYQVKSKMQHYGYPTRLLDVTSNFYKAIAFMVEGIDKARKSEKFPCIFIFEPIAEKVERIYIQEDNNSDYGEFENKFNILVPSNNQSKNIRLHAQSGLFIHFDLKEIKDVSIETVMTSLKEKYKITKLIVKCKENKDIEELEKKLDEYKYGIDTLYPDMLKRSEYYKTKWRK